MNLYLPILNNITFHSQYINHVDKNTELIIFTTRQLLWSQIECAGVTLS